MRRTVSGYVRPGADGILSASPLTDARDDVPLCGHAANYRNRPPVAVVGGLVIALGSSRRSWVGLGGLLIAVGLAAALVALHFGVSPYGRGR
jgi:hypothetical protein